ncbi:hypothetical protein L3X38_002289 [Prunus dulcis]|uniref:Uncharacterized protein n=1 Tax=Prunus dulcis TaxID=3755 RepID=A0AAD4ZJU7_PRUDU|nr:hypothetical protein L3X38_002289 [Prunus dulcis]
MDQWKKTNLPQIRSPPYKTQPGRPKKLRNKEASEVVVPALVSSNPKLPNCIPTLAKLRRVFIKIRPARGKGKGVHRGAIRGGGRGGANNLALHQLGMGMKKRKTPVVSQPFPNNGDSSFSTPPNIVQSSSQPVLGPPNTGQSSPQPITSQHTRFKSHAKRIRPPKTGQSSPQPVSSHGIKFKSPAKKARPWRP